MRGPRLAVAAPVALCLLLACSLGAAAQAAASAPSPVAAPDVAFLQSLGLTAGSPALPAPAGFLAPRPAATCTCTQELADCRSICTGNSCRPDFVCNTTNPCLSSCRCTHCV